MGNELPILSAQQVTACTPNTLSCGGTGGCMGSIPQLAYTYIQLFGHVTEDDWPYTAGTTTMACLQQLDCQDPTPSPPTTNRRSWNISPMLDLSPSLSTPVAGEPMVVESTRAAPTPPTLP